MPGLNLKTVVFVLCWCSASLSAEEWFDAVLPWDDDSSTLISAADLNGSPGQPLLRVSAANGKLVDTSGARIRFLGTNISVLPQDNDADKIAGRLAKFGVNIVRFHHLDASWGENFFHAPWGGRTLDLDTAFLERYDRFRAALAAHGIYSNVNLLTGRAFTSADGLPLAIDALTDFKTRHVVGFWLPAMITLQKEFARKLLTHRSVVTGLPLAEDPNVAIVEINNENGLVHAWLSGQLEPLSAVLTDPLKARWNRFLAQRFSSRAALVDALGFSTSTAAASLVTPSTAPLLRWTLEQHEGAVAKVSSVTGPQGMAGARLEVSKKGSQGWHVQWNFGGITVRAGQVYHVSFWGRAEQPRTIDVGLMMAHDPWQSLGASASVALSREWQRYDVYSLAPVADTNARINFGNLALQLGSLELAGVTLEAGGASLPEGQNPADGSLDLVPRSGGGWPRAYIDLWTQFLAEVEKGYWEEMKDYLAVTLGVKALIIPTILGCTTPEILEAFPVMDAHAYWNHPSFPGVPWDGSNWYVTNTPLVRDSRGGTLTDLALYRVKGKPFTVSEYDHPYPNRYAAEAFPLLGAFAGFQDWDGIYSFVYGPDSRQDWASGRLANYFDQGNNPAKMAGMLLAASLFRRGDVAPGPLESVSRDAPAEMKRLSVSAAWNLGSARDEGLDPKSALVHRVSQVLGGPTTLPSEAPLSGSGADGAPWKWDAPAGVATLDSARDVLLTGFVSGRTFTFSGGLTVRPSGAATQASTWGFTVKQGSSWSDPQLRVVITALGSVRSQGEGLRLYQGAPTDDPPEGAKLTAKPDFGPGPVQLRGVGAEIGLALNGRHFEAWVLNFKGARLRALSVVERDGQAWMVLSPQDHALWYEISARQP